MPVAYLVSTKDGTHYFWTGSDSSILAICNSDGDSREKNITLANSVADEKVWKDACETNPTDGGFVRADPVSKMIQSVNAKMAGGVMGGLQSGSTELQAITAQEGMEGFVRYKFSQDSRFEGVNLDEAVISTIVMSSD